MAHTPNQVTVHITQTELAGQLEELALQYEEVVQTLRWQAENLRSGFDLTLDVRATQVTMKSKTPTTPEEKLAWNKAHATEPEDRTAGQVEKDVVAPRPSVFDTFEPRVGLKPTTADQPIGNLPAEAIKLIDEMTTPTEEEE